MSYGRQRFQPPMASSQGENPFHDSFSFTTQGQGVTRTINLGVADRLRSLSITISGTAGSQVSVNAFIQDAAGNRKATVGQGTLVNGATSVAQEVDAGGVGSIPIPPSGSLIIKALSVTFITTLTLNIDGTTGPAEGMPVRWDFFLGVASISAPVIIGVDPTGATDVTSAIQGILDTVTGSGSVGGYFYFPPVPSGGGYKTTASLLLDPSSIYSGGGVQSAIGFTGPGDGTGWLFKARNQALTSSLFTIIRDMNLVVNSANDNGVDFKSLVFSGIERCYLQHAGVPKTGDGIAFDENSGGAGDLQWAVDCNVIGFFNGIHIGTTFPCNGAKVRGGSYRSCVIGINCDIGDEMYVEDPDCEGNQYGLRIGNCKVSLVNGYFEANTTQDIDMAGSTGELYILGHPVLNSGLGQSIAYGTNLVWAPGLAVHGKVTNPFNTSQNVVDPVTTGFKQAAPAASTNYLTEIQDYFFTSTGGTGVSWSVTDHGGNTLITGAATLTNQYVPVQATVNAGAFSVAPTVTVIGI